LTTDGDTNQQQVGRRFARIRADILGVTQRELAERLTESSGELISPTRISDAERGKANLCKDYADMFGDYLKDNYRETWDTLTLDSEFTELLDKLPSHGMVHRENTSPGNHYDGPRAKPIATVRRGKATPVSSSEEFAVSFSDGRMILTTAAYIITVEPRG